ncbi:unnamed protein product, partial [Prunus brigantina]
GNQDISVLLGPESGQDGNKTNYASPEQESDPRSAPTWGSLAKHIRLTSLIKGKKKYKGEITYME